MNREIKFRAWDNEFKLMNYDVDLNVCKYNGDTVMQYTGLKDKNGKEIYEGDICKWNNNLMSGFSEISFYDGAFRLKDYPFEDYRVLETGTRIEIIGNIYENPELL